MKPSRRGPAANPLKLHLLAGAAVLLMAGAPALAQTPAGVPPPAQPPVVDDGLGDRLGLEADTWLQDENGVVRAKGDVEARYLNRSLRADEADYDPNTGVISANGEVVVLHPDGSASFADTLMLDDQMRAGVATGFATVAGQGRFAAANAILHSEDLNELNMAVFTACPVCTESEDPLAPTWSVSAERIVRDRSRNLVVYRNAVIRVKDVPVFWTPYLSHADPQADYASGLLAPRFQQTRRRGLSYEQPVLWAISPSQDLVVSPQLNTKVNPVINTAWRRRFQRGDIEARVGYTYERDFNTAGLKFGDEKDKAYILAKGRFDIAQDWTAGFAAERVRDKLMFEQYSTPDIYEPRGLFLTDDRRLTSQLYAVRQDEHSYFSISALAFQSLRPLPLSVCALPQYVGSIECAFGVRPLEDDDGLPIVGPLIEARYEPEGPVFGGRLRLRGSAVALERKESPALSGITPLPGIDSRRASAELDWRSFVTLSNGVRLEPFAYARGDFYSVSDLAPDTETTSRALGVVGVDVSWPFIRRQENFTLILEPIAQLALSPDSRPYPLIPNEDSIAFDFNSTNLFEANKPPGFDLYEGGQRLNVGLRGTADWGQGRNAQVIIGRSFRAEVDPVFAERTGLRSRASDWVLAAEATPVAGVSFYTKARLDGDSLSVRQTELGADVDLARGRGSLRYLREEQDFTGLPREDVEAVGEVFVTKHWGLSFDAVRDIESGVWRRVAGGLVYVDDCTRFEVVYQREENPVLGGRASDSLSLRLTLATLGGSGYRDQRRR